MDTVFSKIDSFNRSFLGFNLVGAFRNIRMWRKYILVLTVGSFVAWAVLGWESTWYQLGVYLQSFPSVLLGQVSLSAIHVESVSYYGVGQHLSSAVIYGVCFLLLSLHLEKQGVGKSMNFFFSTALTLMSVGVYELVYNWLYSTCQGQAWTFSFAGKQGLNLAVFTFFVIIGLFSLFYLYSLRFKPRFSTLTVLFVALSVVTYLLWVFYPLPVDSLTVGSWTSTNVFPQTMYAVNVEAGLGSGEAFFVENNLLHLVNVLNKFFMALTVLSLVYVRRIDA